MTKILTKVPCTSCGHESETVIDLEKLARIVPAEKEEKPAPPPEPPKLEEKPKKEFVAERTAPRYLCKGKACEGHDNPAFTERPKKRCTNCKMWGGPADTPKCPRCGHTDDFEEIDDDDLDGMDYPKPMMVMHNHD
jgi:hypothetical protein